MNYFKTLILSFVLLLPTINIFSQESAKLCLKGKAENINAFYKDLITDDNGMLNKSEDELMKLHSIVTDSVPEWAKKFDLLNTEGFHAFCKYTGDKLKVKPGKKIELTFVYSGNSQETFNVWSLGNGKYNIERMQEIKR